MKITFPEGTAIATEEDIQATLGAGQEVMINSGEYTEAQLKLSEQLTIYDFMVTLPDGVSNIQLVNENIALHPGLSAQDYLEAISQQLVALTDLQYECGEVTESKLGGETFKVLPVTALGGAMIQDYYCISKDKRMVSLIVTYVADSEPVIEEILASITTAE